jgi:flavorubredoxin
MREINRTDYYKDVNVTISEITDGIYRISGFSNTFGIIFNQFLIDDEKSVLIHTGSIEMYKNIEEKIKEVIPLLKASNSSIKIKYFL